MATFAVLQPMKLGDHHKLGHGQQVQSEDRIDLDEPVQHAASQDNHDTENLIDMDDPPPPPLPLKPITYLPKPVVTHRKLFGDRVDEQANAMEGVEHHPQPQIYKRQEEDLIDMHPDRQAVIKQADVTDLFSVFHMDEPQRKLQELALTAGAPRGPKALEVKQMVLNPEKQIGSFATLQARPPAPANDRVLKIPTGPSRRLQRSNSQAYKLFLAEQEYWDTLARARARFYQQTYSDWDDMGRGYRGGGGGDRYRGNDRRGGGGGGGGMKRRYDDEDDYDRREYRERRQPASHRIREEIVAIADNPVRIPAEDVAQIAKMIEQDHEDEHFVNSVKELLPHLVVEQPLKVPHAAAIVLHLNDKKPDIAGKILGVAGARAQAALDASDWRSLKLLLRFFACAHSMFEDAGVFTVLEELFNRAVDLQAASSEDTIGIELVKIIMLTVPYVVASGASNIQEKVAELLEKTALVASAELDAEKMVNPYVAAPIREGIQLPKTITLLQTQLQNEAERGWPLKFLPKLYTKQEVNGSGDDSAVPKHAFPALVVPTTINAGPRPLYLELYFSLYADQDVETVPTTSDLAASLMRDALVDTINILDFNRKAVTRILVDIDQYFTPGTFAKRVTPFDIVKNAKEGELTWKPEDVAIDAIFAQLLQLPGSEHKPVYYHSLITETCATSPQAFAPCLGRAIRYLYRSVEGLDLELVARYTDWFSHHLSNYDFRWKWDEWVGDVDLPRIHPKQAFIRDALSKEIRLSFAKRIRDGVPEPYHKLIPGTMDNEIPNFKYNAEETPFAPEAQAILTAFRQKASDEEFAPHIDAIITQASSQTTESNPALLAIDAYVSALCYIGSKSLSHVLSYIERNQARLLSFSRDASSAAAADAARVQIIESVVSYWRETQAGVAVSIVDKLLNYGIISPGSVIAWALGDGDVEAGAPRRADPRDVLPEGWIYEMVSSTLAKVSNRVRQIVAARNQIGVPPASAAALEEALEREGDEMRVLFGVVEDALQSVAAGSDDVMLEEGVGEDGEGEMSTMKLWGGKWVRVFGRKRAVEEAFVREASSAFPEPGVEKVEEVEVEMKDDGVDGGAEAEGKVMNGGGEAAAVNGAAEVEAAGEEAKLIDV